MTGSINSPICAVCQGESTGVSIVDRAAVIYHLCDQPRCAEVAKAWRNKGRGGLSNIEHQAIALAGKAGGAFLMGDLGGKTDMVKLTREEWKRFVTEIIDRYRAELQRLADDGIPF